MPHGGRKFSHAALWQQPLHPSRWQQTVEAGGGGGGGAGHGTGSRDANNTAEGVSAPRRGMASIV